MWTSAWRVSSVYSSTTRYRESQVWLAVYVHVYSHRSDICLGGVWTCAHTYSLIIAPHVYFFTCLICAVGLNRKIILTSKFSRSTLFKGWRKHRPQSEEVLACFRSVFLQLQLVSSPVFYHTPCVLSLLRFCCGG